MKNLSVRPAELSEIGEVIRIFSVYGRELRMLVYYGYSSFDSDGRQRHIRTGYPEELLLAVVDGRIVGCIHFFTDCWGGYEKRILFLAVDRRLSADEARLVESKLRETMSEA